MRCKCKHHCSCGSGSKDDGVSPKLGNKLVQLRDGLYVPNMETEIISTDNSVDIVSSKAADGTAIFDLSSAPHLTLGTIPMGSIALEMPRDRTIFFLDEATQLDMPMLPHSKNIQEMYIVRKDSGPLDFVLAWPAGVTINGEAGPSEKTFSVGNMMHLVRSAESDDWNVLVHLDNVQTILEEFEEHLLEIRQASTIEQFYMLAPAGSVYLQTSLEGQAIRATTGVATVFREGKPTPLIPGTDYRIEADGRIRLTAPLTTPVHYFIETRNRVGSNSQVQMILDGYRNHVALIVQQALDAVGDMENIKEEMEELVEYVDDAIQIFQEGIYLRVIRVITVAGVTTYTHDSTGAPLNLKLNGFMVMRAPFGIADNGLNPGGGRTNNQGHLILDFVPDGGDILHVIAFPRVSNSTAQAIVTETLDARDDAIQAMEDAQNIRDTLLSGINATATTLAPGAAATASYNAALKRLTLGIPSGLKGDKGDPSDHGLFLVPNGNTSAAIQAALNTAGAYPEGGTVTLPMGAYPLTAQLNIPSNVTLKADPMAIIDCNFSTAPAVLMSGSVGPENPITENMVQGGYTLKTAAVFAAGDIVHIWGQRNALSRTDAGEWWCGDGTAGLRYAYFSEFNIIAEVMSTGVYRLANPILFPDYNINAAAETESLRSGTTVRKVTPVRNAHVLGGIWDKRNRASNAVVETVWGYQCSTDIVCLQGSQEAYGVVNTNSWECEARDNVRNTPLLTWDYGVLHGRMNRFVFRGCQDSGVRFARSDYGAQAVDFSYGSSQMISVRPYCVESIFKKCFEGLTSHPGVYGERWQRNEIYDCYDDGIVLRGLAPVVTDNLIDGRYVVTNAVPDLGAAGVSLQYGGHKRATIRNNTIRGFHSGVRISDSSTLNWQARNLDVDISNNNISEVYAGLSMNMLHWTGMRNVLFKNNVITRLGKHLALLSGSCAGTFVENNTVMGDCLVNTGIISLLRDDSMNPGIVFRNNTWIRNRGGNPDQSKMIAWRSGAQNPGTYPEAQFDGLCDYTGNRVSFSLELVDNSLGIVPYHMDAFHDSMPNLIFTIAGGSVKTGRPTNGIGHIKVDTEAGAATDDLDTITGSANNPMRKGDILVVSTSTTARKVTLRDSSVSGMANGIQLPNNASITLNASDQSVVLMWTGTQWILLSADWVMPQPAIANAVAGTELATINSMLAALRASNIILT